MALNQTLKIDGWPMYLADRDNQWHRVSGNMRANMSTTPGTINHQASDLSHLVSARLSPEIVKQVLSFGFVAKEYASHLEKKRTALLQLDNAIARKRAAGTQKWMRKLRHQDMTVDVRYYALLKANNPRRQELIRRDFLQQKAKLEQMLLYYGFGRESLMVSIVVAKAVLRKIDLALADEKYEELATLQQFVRMPLDEFRRICQGLPMI
jgi:hypothetical protein